MFSHCWLAKISSFTTILFLPLLKETGGENMMKKHLMGWDKDRDITQQLTTTGKTDSAYGD